ncbi:MAG: phospholipase [Alphaproteobacteria bacterium]|nr:phospholipase [Alphaproteobacteria bacterium]
MTDATEDLSRLLPPLLGALEALGFVARYVSPEGLPALMAAVGEPDTAVRAAYDQMGTWPPGLSDVRQALESACGEVLPAFEGLRAAAEAGADMGQVYRALRGLPRAQEALYPLAAGLAPVSRFFLDPSVRGDAALVGALAEAAPREDTGVMQAGQQPGERGGFSLYVPEHYSEDRAWPLVVALHGGAGSGRSFLWSWLRDARSFGAILVAPTAVGDTWALTGPDPDTPNLARIVEAVGAHWNIDARRRLLTGMSDGGTFSYVSGLEPGSPFTHLAPVAAAFHPMLAAMADSGRLQGLPIHIVHGALDWMFPVDMAREAQGLLAAAGAAVTYRELPDLAHAYPRELNREILAWLEATAG